MDVLVVLVYLVVDAGVRLLGQDAARRTNPTSSSPAAASARLYSGTMAAVVLGGASTVGGVGLGYKYGMSGMWLVVAIGVGILVLSARSRAGSSG